MIGRACPPIPRPRELARPSPERGRSLTTGGHTVCAVPRTRSPTVAYGFRRVRNAARALGVNEEKDGEKLKRQPRRRASERPLGLRQPWRRAAIERPLGQQE